MSQLGNDILTALASFSKDYEESQASTGSVWRPPAGEWNTRLKEIKCETQGQFVELPDGQKIPALKVTFQYSCMEPYPPDMPAVGGDWPGKMFLIPIGGVNAIPGDPEKGRKKAISIDLQRFKGHMQSILGALATGKAEIDLPAAAQKVNSPDVVALRVRTQYDEDKQGRKWPKEFIVRNLAAA